MSKRPHGQWAPSVPYTHAIFRPYVTALGQLALAWNDLHETLAMLFLSVMGGGYGSLYQRFVRAASNVLHFRHCKTSSGRGGAQMTRTSPPVPRTKAEWLEVLKNYQITDAPPLYLLGSFDDSVTVRSQQIRALNLACGLIESSMVPARTEATKRLAIVGTGFAGLTLAAALLKKQTALEITLFEERDTLLPLQQGSDSRWLHPRIYDWPADQSEASAAMLPVLNWTAARASDVVVQVLGEWHRLVEEAALKPHALRLFCNTLHLQIDRCPDDPKRAQLEWVGDPREPSTGHSDLNDAATGESDRFDAVVLAVGFGPEKMEASSYWRNETLGQPSLTHSRATYLVSGQGDGAMIDLLRLRISQYRQDRILEELFHDKQSLLRELRRLRADVENENVAGRLFDRFEALRSVSTETQPEWDRLLVELRQRLRRDTEVVLHLKPEVRNIANLFDLSKRRMSFQNAFLVFLLYRCGGFAPSIEHERPLCERLGIRPEHIVRRHGPNRRFQFTKLLAKELDELVVKEKLRQPAEIQWRGGYFGIPGRLSEAEKIESDEREAWRKEYLPGPTAMLATTLCGAVAGVLAHLRPEATHDRVALHRVIELNGETLLQQACDYAGRTEAPKQSPTGRTFPTDIATIGQAYICRQPIRSLKDVTPEELQKAMDLLRLKTAARDMAPQVKFVLAIPILQPSTEYAGPSSVSGVLYIDSRSDHFWLGNAEVSEVCRVLEVALRGLADGPLHSFERLRNIPLADIRTKEDAAASLRTDVLFALEMLASVQPPVSRSAFQFNFDVTDLTAVS